MSILEISNGTPRPALASLDDLIEFDQVLAGQIGRIGGRAARLARARRAGLAIPNGVVIVADALGYRPVGGSMLPIVDQLTELFDTLGHQGRAPLRVSLSALRPESCADSVDAARPITELGELLHAVRRFSVTATILGDTVAVIVQQDIEAHRAGRLETRSDAHRHDHRLDRLARNVVDLLGGNRTVDWAIDGADRIWILDIGPDLRVVDAFAES